MLLVILNSYTMATAGKITGLTKIEQGLASRSIAEERTVGGRGTDIVTTSTAAAESYLQKLKYAIQVDGVPVKERMAVTWFRSIVERARAALARENVPQYIKIDAAQRGTLTGRLIIGKMYFFMYEPKHKGTLPYYDMFPLVLPIQKFSNGFLGINFHYVNMKDRAILFDEIKIFVNDRTLGPMTRIKLKYDLLRGFTRFKRAKPCLKRYLTTYMKSQFIPVGTDEWASALFLPVEQFRKRNKQAVWAESKEIFSRIRQ